jgi:hypothetical protein
MVENPDMIIFLSVGVGALFIAVFLYIRKLIDNHLSDFKMNASSIGFSVNKNDDELTYIYCYDKDLNYCFSLVRIQKTGKIEVMVHDQIFKRVDDLYIVLKRNSIFAKFDKELALRLDKKKTYTISFDIIDEKYVELEAVMKEIFMGKSGLRIEKI